MTAPDRPTASMRAPLDHASRKVRYSIVAVIVPELGALSQALEGLISELRVTNTDPATWDELITLRRYVRETTSQVDHLTRANNEWAARAAAASSTVPDHLPDSDESRGHEPVT